MHPVVSNEVKMSSNGIVVSSDVDPMRVCGLEFESDLHSLGTELKLS